VTKTLAKMAEWEKLEDKWGFLWRSWDSDQVDPFALETCFPDWIQKVREEGNKLKSKAEKFDNLLRHYGIIEGEDIYEEINEAVKLKAEWRFNKKLDELNNLILKWNDRINTFEGQWNAIHNISINDVIALQVQYRSELKQILGGS